MDFFKCPGTDLIPEQLAGKGSKKYGLKIKSKNNLNE